MLMESSNYITIQARLEATGRAFRTRRKAVGLTIHQLADKAGMCYSSIALFESGKQIPSLANVYKLCDAVGVSPLDILHP